MFWVQEFDEVDVEKQATLRSLEAVLMDPEGDLRILISIFNMYDTTGSWSWIRLTIGPPPKRPPRQGGPWLYKNMMDRLAGVLYTSMQAEVPRPVPAAAAAHANG